MTQAEFKRKMSVWGNAFYKDTCPPLQVEITRKIVNCKALTDFERASILQQYIENRATNQSIADGIKKYSSR